MISKDLSPLLIVAFFLLVAYLPFQIALNLTPDIDLMSGRILILGLALLGLIKIWSQTQLSFKGLFKDRVSVFLLIFFILTALSILIAENQGWGLRKLLVFGSIFPLFWLVGLFIKNNKDEEKLIFIILGSAVISALIALIQFFSQFIFGQGLVITFWSGYVLPLFSGAQFGALVALNPSWQAEVSGQAILRAIGLFSDPHMLSFYLGLTSPFSLALAFLGKKHRLVFGAIFIFLSSTLLLTFSRGGYFGLIISLVVFGFLGQRFFGRKEKKFFAASALLLAVLLFFIGWPIVARLSSSFDLAEGSNVGRLAIWQDSWNIIKKSPMLGVGLGNYSLAIDPGQNYRNSITSHNLYLDILVETGILGLVAWFLLFVAAAGAAIKKIKNTPVVALGVLGALAYFFTHSFFESAIFNPTVLAFLMVMLGLAALNKEGTIKEQN